MAVKKTKQKHTAKRQGKHSRGPRLKTPRKFNGIKRARIMARMKQPLQQVAVFAPEPESMTEVEIETEKKLSAKIIVGKRIGKIDAPKDLFTVIGIATGTKTGQSNYGEWVGLRGQFEVIRCDDGKVLRAPLMILPDAAMEVVMTEAVNFPFEFALVVAVDPATNTAGFEYHVKPVIYARPHDPLNVLRLHLLSADRGRE
jgi:hypothetical protein